MGSLFGSKPKAPEITEEQKQADRDMQEQRLEQESEIKRRRLSNTSGRGSLLTGAATGVSDTLG